MADDGLMEYLIKFAHPGGSFQDRTERRDIQKFTEVVKYFMLGKMQALVQSNANNRVMVKVYGSDGTPFLTNQSWVRSMGKNHPPCREGLSRMADTKGLLQRDR